MATTGNHTERAHQPLGGSTAERWLICPGYRALSKTVPDTPSSLAMKEGTETHEIVEKMALGLDPTRAPMGPVYDGSDNWLRANGVAMNASTKAPMKLDQALRVAHAHRAYKQLMEKVRDASFPNEIDVWEPECFLDGKELDPNGECGPNADLVFGVKGGWGCVTDYKDGSKEVKVEGLPQNALAAVLAAEKFGFTHVLTAIVQPKVEMDASMIEPQTWLMTPELLAEWRVRFIKSILRSYNEPEVFVGGHHCDWCKAQAACPAQKANAVAVFNDDIKVAEVLKTPEEAVGTLNAEQLRGLQFLLEYGPRIEKTIKAARALAVLVKTKNPELLPDYKFVEGKAGNRKWADPTEAAEVLDLNGVPCWEKVLKSPTVIEKDLGKKGFKEYDSLVSRAKGGLSLVNVKDKRPAITLDPTSVFDALPGLDEEDSVDG